jgi:xanthine dehydrogenase FAD-binding subunit
MIRNVEIVLPETLHDALVFVSEKDSCLIAGGTDVVPGMNQNSERFKDAKRLVDINHVTEIKGIEINGDKISIGAAETFSDLLRNEIVKEYLPLLWKAASTIGSTQIRNRATIAGNFVNNAPCADSVPVLLVYNASIEIESPDSKREIALCDFLDAPYKTSISPNEIVTHINIPVPQAKLVGDFYKLGRRRAVAVSRITLAVLLGVNENKINEIRIASGAITPIGLRFNEIEKYAHGKIISDYLVKELAKKVGEKIINVTGMRWSSEYKLPVVQQMFYQLTTNLIIRID